MRNASNEKGVVKLHIRNRGKWDTLPLTFFPSVELSVQ